MAAYLSEDYLPIEHLLSFTSFLHTSLVLGNLVNETKARVNVWRNKSYR